VILLRSLETVSLLCYIAREFSCYTMRREVNVEMTADRRAGKGIPHVGKQPRDRNKDGSWRKKRSDAGKPRKK
jgi:hypothetical protein